MTREFFDAIAKQYDRNNTVLSLGLHKRWNQALINAVSPTGGTLLDLCAGTGAIGLTALKTPKPPSSAILVDFSHEMLAIARSRAPGNATCIEADVQKLPLEDLSVDAVTQAYGIRNVADPVQCAREVYRVLRPGGLWGILELTRPPNRFIAPFHNLYLRTLVPTLGRLLSSDKQAYSYLSSSIRHFVDPNTLAAQIETTGFKLASCQRLTLGTATLVVFEKPATQ